MSIQVRGSSSEQVWTDLQEWPPDDISKWRSLCIEVQVEEEGWEALYGEVQCTMGNGHMATSCWQNDWLMDRHDVAENITFLQLRLRAVKVNQQLNGGTIKSIL